MKTTDKKMAGPAPDDRDPIAEFFRSIQSVIAVFLFGSVASGTQRSDSDIDVAILMDQNINSDPLSIIHLREDLSALMKREIDLVCLNTAPVILRMQVLKNGQKIFDRNARATNTFISRTVFEYDDLKRVRKPIETNLLRGRIYG